ncbi:MAG: hypothetical protein JNL79_01320 [Myxococcales bacterium]|nr:hypothetical protein [Myxococcales bacterium]
MKPAREQILRRRAQFVAAALAGLTAGCGATIEEPRSDAATDGATDASVDSIPTPCLGIALDTGVADTGPTPCLEPPFDASSD